MPMRKGMDSSVAATMTRARACTCHRFTLSGTKPREGTATAHYLLSVAYSERVRREATQRGRRGAAETDDETVDDGVVAVVVRVRRLEVLGEERPQREAADEAHGTGDEQKAHAAVSEHDAQRPGHAHVARRCTGASVDTATCRGIATIDGGATTP
jgi:hypothetical protein